MKNVEKKVNDIKKEERMTNVDVEKKVKEIIKDKLGLRLLPEDHLKLIDDLGADSLDIVELIIAFEDSFEIDIPDDDAEKLKTVKEVENYISIKVNNEN